MMRPFIIPVVLLMLSPYRTIAALPSSPLEPVYHALFTQRNDLAWQHLIGSWSKLNSLALHTAWRQALDAVISGQCGNDLPITSPAWVDHPSLEIIQRDIPLNRIYRVQLSGNSPRRNLQFSLSMPNGKVILEGTEADYDASGQFRLASQDQERALPAGSYVLTIRSGGDLWQQALALQGWGNLDWIQRKGDKVYIQPPVIPSACPNAWLEQALLSRNKNYEQIAWLKSTILQPQPWSDHGGTVDLWGRISVIRIEARGGLTLRLEHRLAGPLLTLQK